MVDANGNITRKDDSALPRNYGYDALDRLIGDTGDSLYPAIGDWSYLYEGNGNRTGDTGDVGNGPASRTWND